MHQKENWLVKPTKTIAGTLQLPGDKSISHRSIMLGAIAEGVTEIYGLLEGEDCLRTRDALIALGVRIETNDTSIKVHGKGLHGLKPAAAPLDFGNSGTGMRLMAGLLSGQVFSSCLIGDPSLMSRPMQRVVKPLSAMGAAISVEANGCAPIHISKAPSPLKGISYEQPVSSAQVKSALLLAGLYAEGETVIIEPGISRNHSEKMLVGFGVDVTSTVLDSNKIKTTLKPGNKLVAQTIKVPVDISSAAFFMVAALIAKEGNLLLENVGINPTRTGVINILKAMGAEISFENERVESGEPVADLRLQHSSLVNITVPLEQVALAIDEFPVLFVAAACASGDFILRGAKELRVKESDRIEAMADGLKALGVELEVYDDGIKIKGDPDRVFKSATVNSQTDHRIAMSFVVAGLRAEAGGITVLDCENVSTSFPCFAEIASNAGFDIKKA